MARRLTYAEKMRLARRTSDITRLQSEYQRSVQDYTAAVGGKESIFNQEMAKYNELYSGYESRLNAYQSRLSDYQNRLKQYQDAPVRTIDRVKTGGVIPQGKFVYIQDLLKANQMPTYHTIPAGYEYIHTGAEGGGFLSGKDVPNPGQFNETFSETAPTAPTIDISAEKAKLDESRAYTEREVDERTRSRVRAVQRANARPMLSQGVRINGQS